MAAALLALPGGASAAEDAIAAGLKSTDAAARQAAEAETLKAGAAAVPALCALYGGDDVTARRRADALLFSLVAGATAPGASERAQALREALLAQMESKEAPARARSHAAELLALLGGGKDAAARLAAALSVPETYDEARAALQRQRGPEATQALLAAVPQVPAEKRPPLLLSLGARRDPAAVKPLLKWAGDADAAMRAAALQALGLIGDASAARAVEKAAADPAPEARKAAVGALLAIADARRARDQGLAARLYRAAFAAGVNGGQKLAAVRGLREAGSPQFLPTLFAALKDAGAGRAAYRILLSLEGDEARQAVLARLPGAKGNELSMLLAYCSDRPQPNPADLERVQALLERAEARDDAARACLAIADSLAGAGKKEAAVAAYTRLVKLEPQPPAAKQAVEKLKALNGQP